MFPPLALPWALPYDLLLLVVDLLAVRELRASPERLGLVTTRTALVALVLALPFLFASGDRFVLILLLCHALFLHAPALALTVAILRRDRLGALYGAIAAALLAVAVDAFVIEPRALEIAHHTLPIPGLVRPLTVVLLADLQTDDPDDGQTREALLATMAQEPDLILLAGDYVQHPHLGDHLQLLTRFNALVREVGLAAPLGVVAVQGNVEHPRRWPELFAGTDVHASPQTQQILTDELAITALSFEDGFNADLHLPAPRHPHLVLAHAPDFALGEIEADLLLAGHTHGGQIQLPLIGPLMTLSAVPRAWAHGLNRLPSGAHLLVSRGVGMERDHAPRLRFLCRPEVVVLHLTPG
jgi:predicted MPP superfamily phosphohydrolase